MLVRSLQDQNAVGYGFFRLFYDIGKRVIHSERSKKKLLEVKKALNAEALVIPETLFCAHI